MTIRFPATRPRHPSLTWQAKRASKTSTLDEGQDNEDKTETLGSNLLKDRAVTAAVAQKFELGSNNKYGYFLCQGRVFLKLWPHKKRLMTRAKDADVCDAQYAKLLTDRHGSF